MDDSHARRLFVPVTAAVDDGDRLNRCCDATAQMYGFGKCDFTRDNRTVKGVICWE